MNDENALLVCPQGRGGDKLKLLVNENQVCSCRLAASGGEARRLMTQESFSLMVINAPLGDESGLELALEAARSTLAAVVLLVKAEWMDQVFSTATEAGVLALAKPLNPALFGQALGLGRAMHSRLAQMGSQYQKLESRLEEIRVVDRAKCLLIQHLNLSEEEAHRAIEKQAMDTRLSRLRVAKELIRRFEL